MSDNVIGIGGTPVKPLVHASRDVEQIIDILSDREFTGRDIAIALAKHDPSLFLELHNVCNPK